MLNRLKLFKSIEAENLLEGKESKIRHGPFAGAAFEPFTAIATKSIRRGVVGQLPALSN